MTSQVLDWLRNMTLEEKASFCSGSDFWHLQGLRRLGIPSVMVTDGPHGLRKQEGKSDHVGLSESFPATCFPTAATLACSWNRELLENIGAALGRECRSQGVAVLLGPGVNIKRNPLCGRNFEYFSEDPLLSGKLAVPYIRGVQSCGVGTSLKHFVANNQEYYRYVSNSVVDERTLREIYLKPFEIAVKEGKPWTVMSSYNKINSVYTGENFWLLTEVLREQWGFSGAVITDWGAADDRVEALRAGGSLEMPSSHGLHDRLIVQAVKEGSLREKDLNNCAGEVLSLIEKSLPGLKDGGSCSYEQHHQLAAEAAEQSMVLLKNSSGLLPVKRGSKTAVLGDFAWNPRYQGSGSSLINPYKLPCFAETVKELFGEEDIIFARGFDLASDTENDELVEEALLAAADKDQVILFLGLPPSYESEGFDREHLKIPENQISLLEKVARINPATIVVLSCGSSVEMPWIENAGSLLLGYLGGQAAAVAAARILFGEVNPSGKLAETFPLNIEDCSSSRYFPGVPRQVEYREGLFVGYRWFDSSGTDVLFPFGYGLSYTSFCYENLVLSRESMKETDDLKVSLSLRNTGDRAGAEILQLYIRHTDSVLVRPKKELKEFCRVELVPGETKEVSFSLSGDCFTYWDIESSEWQTEAGVYEILIGASSRDIRLRKSLRILSSHTPVSTLKKDFPAYTAFPSGFFSISDEEYTRWLGSEIPALPPDRPFHRNSTLSEIRQSLIGKIFYREVLKATKEVLSGADENHEEDPTMLMVERMIPEMPLRSLILMNSEYMDFNFLKGLLLLLNRRIFKGIRILMKEMNGFKIPKPPKPSR